MYVQQATEDKGGNPVAAFERGFCRANRWLLVGMMAAMVALVFGNVVVRYLFGYSIIWAEELSQYLMVWIAYLGAGLALREGRHVSVDILQEQVPPAARRAVRTFILLLLLAFFIVLTVLGWRFAVFAWEQESPVMQIPLGLAYAAVSVGSAVLVIHLLLFLREFVAKRFEESEDLEYRGEA